MNVLFLGETYTASHTYIRGADYVTLPEYGDTGAAFAGMLRAQGFLVTHIPTHDIVRNCPLAVEDFTAYDAVILSDVGSNTMLTNPKTADGRRLPNRLASLRTYVAEGGGLLMCGGYFSFSGVGNTARYGMTPLADALPVSILHCDDRMECPQGVSPEIRVPEHPVFEGIDVRAWPHFYGYNKVCIRPQAQELACLEGNTFLACMEYGKGRTCIFASDCAPDWASEAFLTWDGYPRLFGNMMHWLTDTVRTMRKDDTDERCV